MAKKAKVQVYDAESGELYSVPIEGFKTVNEECEVDVSEALAWLKKYDCKYAYDDDGDIAVSEITWEALQGTFPIQVR